MIDLMQVVNTGTHGQGGEQIEELLAAFLLSALVGLEREIHKKSAGLKTHTLVGVSAALFMLISKYGFMDVLDVGKVVLDPSRVAAQIVSGIGFIGGGVIFMRRDIVRGLTTAAAIWFTAALGMACGAGLLILAVVTACVHFVIMTAFPLISRHLLRPQVTSGEIEVVYQDSPGILRGILLSCSKLKFTIDKVKMENDRVFAMHDEIIDQADREGVDPDLSQRRLVTLRVQVKGKRPVTDLVARLSAIGGVNEVSTVGDESD